MRRRVPSSHHSVGTTGQLGRGARSGVTTGVNNIRPQGVSFKVLPGAGFSFGTKRRDIWVPTDEVRLEMALSDAGLTVRVSSDTARRVGDALLYR